MLTANLESTLLLYADDLTPMRPVARPIIDYPQLLEDLYHALMWSHPNRLPFNEAKCTSMLVHHSRQTPPPVALVLAGTLLQRAAATKLLRVILDSQVRFTVHIVLFPNLEIYSELYYACPGE